MKLRYNFIFFILIILSSCNQAIKSSDTPIINNALNEANEKFDYKNNDIEIDTIVIPEEIQKKIFDTILALPEVKKEAKYIEKCSNGERHLIIWFNPSQQDLNEKYYWVKVGEDNGDAYSTHFNFFIYPENFEIKFLNTVLNDSIMSLDSWRKERKQ